LLILVLPLKDRRTGRIRRFTLEAPQAIAHLSSLETKNTQISGLGCILYEVLFREKAFVGDFAVLQNALPPSIERRRELHSIKNTPWHTLYWSNQETACRATPQKIHHRSRRHFVELLGTLVGSI